MKTVLASPRILIADDSRLTRTLIRNALSPAGCEVVGEAKTAGEVMDLSQRFKPDLITLDMTMPEMRDLESLRDILEMNPQGKVLVVTAPAKKLDLREMEQVGAGAVINKPFKPNELLDAAGRLVELPSRRREQAAGSGVILEDAGQATNESLALTQEQVSDLMEVGNVGAGNAAARLSELIHRRCVIGLPHVAYVDAPSLEGLLEAEDSFVVAVYTRIAGDVPAAMLVLLKRQHAHLLVKYTTKAALEGGGRELAFTAQFALKQMCEAMTRAFVNSLNQFLGTKTKYAMPEIVMAPWPKASEALSGKMRDMGALGLVIYCAFSDPEKTFEGRFAYILGEASQRVILERILRLLNGLAA